MLGRIALHSGKTIRQLETEYSWQQIIALFEVWQLDRLEFLQMIFGTGDEKKSDKKEEKGASQDAKKFFVSQTLKKGGKVL